MPVGPHIHRALKRPLINSGNHAVLEYAAQGQNRWVHGDYLEQFGLLSTRVRINQPGLYVLVTMLC